MSVPVRLDPSQLKKLTDQKSVSDLLLAILGVFDRGSEGDPLVVVLDLSGLTTAIGDVASAVREILKPQKESGFHFEGGGFVRIYAGDRPAENVEFRKPVVTDSEGTPVSPQPDLSYTFSSSNPDVVSVADNGDGSVAVDYKTPHQLDDGSFEIIETRAESNTITLDDGTLLKDVKTEQIQLLPGKAAGFAGGGFQFPPDGSEAAPPPPVGEAGGATTSTASAS